MVNFITIGVAHRTDYSLIMRKALLLFFSGCHYGVLSGERGMDTWKQGRLTDGKKNITFLDVALSCGPRQEVSHGLFKTFCCIS